MFATGVGSSLGVRDMTPLAVGVFDPFPIRGLACIEFRLKALALPTAIPAAVQYEVTNNLNDWVLATAAFAGFTVIGDDSQDPTLFMAEGYSWLWVAVNTLLPDLGFLPMPYSYARVTLTAPAADMGDIELFVSRTA
jgi:hypothetical protein